MSISMAGRRRRSPGARKAAYARPRARSTNCWANAMDDPRLTPARPDLAAKYLEGKVKAARFVAGETREIIDAIAPLRRAPSSDAMLDTQALRGERVTIYDRDGEGWAWGQLASDGYVGWVPNRALAKPGPALTHKVTALRTLVFPGLYTKLPPIDTLTLGARIAVDRQEGSFAITRDGAVCRRNTSAHSIVLSAISSRSRSNSPARPICGAARPASASTVPVSCRLH